MEAGDKARHNMDVGLKKSDHASRTIGKRGSFERKFDGGGRQIGLLLNKRKLSNEGACFLRKGPFSCFRYFKMRPKSQARGSLIASPYLSLSCARPCCGMSLLAATVPCSACLPISSCRQVAPRPHPSLPNPLLGSQVRYWMPSGLLKGRHLRK